MKYNYRIWLYYGLIHSWTIEYAFNLTIKIDLDYNDIYDIYVVV